MFCLYVKLQEAILFLAKRRSRTFETSFPPLRQPEPDARLCVCRYTRQTTPPAHQHGSDHAAVAMAAEDDELSLATLLYAVAGLTLSLWGKVKSVVLGRTTDSLAEAVDLPSEVWAHVAKHRGVVGAFQLMTVCRATRAGGKEFRSSLPALAVCGGHAEGVGTVRDVLRLDLATMRLVHMPALATGRNHHACLAVRGKLVVLGGGTAAGPTSRRVEMLSPSEEGGAFVDLPPLSCRKIRGAATVAVDESDSAAGQVPLLGGEGDDTEPTSAVQLVDLATGACAPQGNLLRERANAAVGQLPDGRVCAGGMELGIRAVSAAEVLEPPAQGAADAGWSWRGLPEISARRWGCRGCVMSDGCFAVLGGWSNRWVGGRRVGGPTSSCEALTFVGRSEALGTVGGVAYWAPLPPMHDARVLFAAWAVAGCVIAAGGNGGQTGGQGLKSAELYDEECNRWLRLPCDLRYASSLSHMGSALL
jgi:hypothetical protein